MYLTRVDFFCFILNTGKSALIFQLNVWPRTWRGGAKQHRLVHLRGSDLFSQHHLPGWCPLTGWWRTLSVPCLTWTSRDCTCEHSRSSGVNLHTWIILRGWKCDFCHWRWSLSTRFYSCSKCQCLPPETSRMIISIQHHLLVCASVC